MHDVNVKPEPDTKGQARKPSLPQSSAAPPHHRHSVYGYIGHEPGGGGKDDYDEIDQIYDYVRGFAPLPKSAKGWQYIAESGHEAGDKKEPIYQKLSVPQPENAENKPPEPPPIDTIPGRRVSAAEPSSPPCHAPAKFEKAHESGPAETGREYQVNTLTLTVTFCRTINMSRLLVELL